MKVILRCSAALLICTTLAQPSWAQFKNDEEAVKYRQGVFTAMKVHFGRIGAMVQGKQAFDAGLAQQDAEVVRMLSALPWIGFAESTDGLSSHAKPEIWMEAKKFQQHAQALQEKAAALESAAQSRDLATIKAAFGAVGKSCKTCHDAFRQ